ncbi:MAG: prepilin-type N-terminal cleavage/methylation domain-containing protein [Planctomycetes bacterium]|nr:prepilin-type N-terminal cleavage/methylation domain-containing protein [Planctomycetota bacterium]
MPRTKNQHLNNTGFTLVEVIIALVVVSISLLGLIRLHLISISMAEVAEVTSQAVLLAEEKIAETLASGYPEKGIKSGEIEKNAQILHWRTEVADLQSSKLTNAEITGLRRICVEVGFKRGSGFKNLQMSTYVADRRLP